MEKNLEQKNWHDQHGNPLKPAPTYNLEQIIADYCTAENLPQWHTVEEILELNHSSNNALQLTYSQKEQLYKFKEQLEKIY